jgi:hypothetical protein
LHMRMAYKIVELTGLHQHNTDTCVQLLFL